MRIAVLSDTIFPTPYDRGHGLGRSVFNVARGLVQRGHDVTLFGLDGSQLPGGRVITTPVNAWRGERELAEQVDRLCYDVAIDAGHTHVFSNAGILPCISWFHDRASQPGPNPVYVSMDQRDYCKRWGPIVRNGVKLSEYPLSRKRRNGRLLFVGSNLWHKGLEIARHVATLTGMPLDEYGAGTLGGPIAGADKVKAMQNASWLVFPSHVEAGPLTPLEAMACGTPVVALAKAGTVEYVPQPLLAHDAAGLAARIRTANRPPPRMLRQWVREGFTVKRQADGIEKLLESVANGVRW